MRSMFCWLSRACFQVAVVATTQPERTSALRKAASRSVRLAASRRLLHVEREIIDDEGCLEGRVLRADKVDLDRLAFVGEEAEGLLAETRGGVGVRVGRESREHCA